MTILLQFVSSEGMLLGAVHPGSTTTTEEKKETPQQDDRISASNNGDGNNIFSSRDAGSRGEVVSSGALVEIEDPELEEEEWRHFCVIEQQERGKNKYSSALEQKPEVDEATNQHDRTRTPATSYQKAVLTISACCCGADQEAMISFSQSWIC